ncbi:MAG: Nif3-like dinuclear metal center hexameric protein [Bacteroidota bacterium]|nr:Nif3-like dinuclear metal center hexameric protein [Candidatus Kapabacteria bacterium]MDW8074671.1 Nif3-like dinuclear metal center hexameric protein [Bacteroidota bacterium]MDW8270853.1 Nif3-like dinuclear metal center hexameric protein [Bacteroidota bacterium]
MTAEELYALLQHELPASEAMPDDRIGIQVEPAGHTIRGILTCLEVTEAVIEEALVQDCNCIVTFHPLIFSPLYSLRPEERVSRCVMRAVQHNISIVSVHTALDAHPEGTNAYLASRLGISIERPLVPSRQREGYGMGIVGVLPRAMSAPELAEWLGEQLSATVRYCIGAIENIEKVAIVAGSGMSFFDAAVESGAHAFITADVKYHGFHRATGRIALLDPGHFEMEQFVPEILANIIHRVLAQQNMSLPIHACSIRTSPVQVNSSKRFDNGSFTTTVSTNAIER